MDANYTVGWVERSDTHQSKHHRAPSLVVHAGMMAMGIAALDPSYAGLTKRHHAAGVFTMNAMKFDT